MVVAHEEVAGAARAKTLVRVSARDAKRVAAGAQHLARPHDFHVRHLVKVGKDDQGLVALKGPQHAGGKDAVHEQAHASVTKVQGLAVRVAGRVRQRDVGRRHAR